VVKFPETLLREWKVVADSANAGRELRKRIERGTRVEKETESLRIRHEANLIFQQELDADTTPELEMNTLDDYKNNPGAAPVDLIDGVLKKNGTCLMLGPSGSGKSTIALQMLYSLMTGDDWLGQTAKPLTGGVGIVSYDMDAAMVLDWMSGYPNVDPRKVSVVNAHKRGNPLGVPALRKQLVEAWQFLGVEVVVIDSFSASFFGRDQNDAAATMDHYRDLQRFALTECGAKALIVIVHSKPGSPDAARGSSVHHDVADSIVSVSGIGSESRKMHMAKYRAGIGQQGMKPAILGVPDSVTHLVDLDLGAMALDGMQLPSTAGAAMFTNIPDAHEAPDTTEDPNAEEEDL
jgi:energy-coupling factor transporter ATP-binding protein EcfA2